MSESRPIPYPADTSAKGWRFELDHEKIRKSDTWALAPRDVRPWLLLLWMVAWEQVPCGSLPDSDELIIARLEVTAKFFEKNRGAFLRGWYLAVDGRLYHETITLRVHEMLKKRANDAQRAANRRARLALSEEGHDHTDEDHEGITSASRVTPTGVRPEFDTKHQAPSTLNSEAKASDAADASSVPGKAEKPKPDPEKQRLWREGKALLVADGLSMAEAGKFIGKLAVDYPEVVKDAVDATLKATPPDPKAYLVATCQRLAGERNTVQSDAADKTRAALDADTAHASDLTPEERAERIAKARAAVAAITSQTLTEKAPATGEATHVDD